MRHAIHPHSPVVVETRRPTVLEEGPLPPLAARLRKMALDYCAGDARVLTCEFALGGRTHGVGVPSVLWCRQCGQPRMWHDVAIAAAVVEREERPPLFREDD